MPILSQQAFAQVDSQDNLTLPPWGNPATTPNAIFRDLTDTGILGDANAACGQTILSGNLPVNNAINGPTSFNLHPTVPGVVNNQGGAVVTIDNLIDPLLLKSFQIEHTYCEIGTGPTPVFPTVSGISCKDPTGNTAGVFGISTGVLTGEPGQTPGSIYIKELWNCEPNPDWEEITLQYDPTRFALIQVAVNTVSEGSPSIGGTFEGVNSTALLVAGAQANALWLIPLITAIGIGIVIVKRKTFF